MKIKGSEAKGLTTLLGNAILKNKGGVTTKATTIFEYQNSELHNCSQKGNVVHVNGYLYLTLQLTFNCL